MVIINYIHPNIFYLKIGRPRHKKHNHAREDKYQPRQEGVAEQLLEFFLYKIFNHNLFLNFLKLIVINRTAIKARILTSDHTNEMSTPSIINLRTA